MVKMLPVVLWDVVVPPTVLDPFTHMFITAIILLAVPEMFFGWHSEKQRVTLVKLRSYDTSGSRLWSRGNSSHWQTDWCWWPRCLQHSITCNITHTIQTTTSTTTTTTTTTTITTTILLVVVLARWCSGCNITHTIQTTTTTTATATTNTTTSSSSSSSSSSSRTSGGSSSSRLVV